MQLQYLWLIIVGLLIFIEIDRLKKQVKSQQKQIDALCEQTGNHQLATSHISEDERAYILQLKNSGKTADAVKKTRALTAMELTEAKRYVNSL